VMMYVVNEFGQYRCQEPYFSDLHSRALRAQNPGCKAPAIASSFNFVASAAGERDASSRLSRGGKQSK